jgi:hypothetical protein
MDLILWIVGIVLGLGVLAFAPRWVPALLWRFGEPGKLNGLDVDYTAARIDEDRVIDRIWAASIVMRNDSHRPRSIPVMAAKAVFWSNRRGRFGLRQSWYVGHLVHDFEYQVVQQNGVLGDRVLNPGDEVVFTAYVTLPGDQHPERLQIASWDGTKEVKRLHARLPKGADA